MRSKAMDLDHEKEGDAKKKVDTKKDQIKG